jgi:hypothetical protein
MLHLWAFVLPVAVLTLAIVLADFISKGGRVGRFLVSGCTRDLWLVLQQRRPARVLLSTHGPSRTDHTC